MIIMKNYFKVPSVSYPWNPSPLRLLQQGELDGFVQVASPLTSIVLTRTVCVEKETSTHIAAHIPLTYFLKLFFLGSSSSSTSKHGVAATVLGTGLVSNGS